MAFLGQIFNGGKKDKDETTSKMPHYDNGGGVAPLNTVARSGTNQLAAASAMAPQPQAISTQMQPQAVAAQTHPGVGGAIGAIGSTIGDGVNLVGGALQGIGSAFTAQNQYNAKLAPTMQSDYSGVINQSANNALGGYGQYGANQAQQQGVADQLQDTSGMYRDIANGNGPNPAQAALNQNTAQNVANQSALMAGQRGAGSNVGLMARQAAMQGANTQQQAVGQGATMQANQQLAGLSGLQGNQVAQGQLYGQMGSQIQGQQNVNAGLFSNAANAQNAQNNTGVANYGMMQGVNSQVAQNNANAVNKTTAGLLGGIGSFIGLAEGGEVPDPISKSSSSDSTPMGSIHSQYAPDLSYTPAPQSGSSGGPLSFVGNFFKSGQSSSGLAAAAPEAAELMLAKGGKVSAMVSPGEKYLTPKEASKVAKGEASSSHVGRVVPGTPKFKGNNYANDIVPAKLEAGGIVIPNSIMQSKDPEKSAAAFVRAHLSKNKGLKRK